MSDVEGLFEILDAFLGDYDALSDEDLRAIYAWSNNAMLLVARIQRSRYV